jgi:hypothetical protein
MPALTRPTLPTRPDEERLNAVLDRIRENEYALDMRYFYRTGIEDVCDTTRCFAGHAIELFAPRGKFTWNADVAIKEGGTAAWSVIVDEDVDLPDTLPWTTLPGGKREVSAAYYAAALLGLGQDQSEALFYYLVHDVDMLAAKVEQILNGEITNEEV